MATTILTVNNAINPGQGNSDFARTQVETDLFALPTSAGDAKFFDKSQFSGLSIYVSAACTLTFYGCTKTAMRASTTGNTATAVPLYDKTGTAISVTIPAEGIVNLNPELFSMPYIAPVSGGAANAILIATK